MQDLGSWLLTHYGTVLCLRDGRAVHLPFAEVAQAGDAAEIRTDGRFAILPGLGPWPWRLSGGAARGTIALQRRDAHLCASGYGEWRTDIEHLQDWESHVLLPVREARLLAALVFREWSTGGGAPAPFSVGKNFMLEHADGAFALVDNFASEFGAPVCRPAQAATQDVREIVLWREGWQPVTFTRYRPLVYFCTFGTRSLTTLALAVEALVRFGAYDGDVLVIGDLDADALCAHCPALASVRLHVWQVEGCARQDAFNARYMIGEWAHAGAFGPFLYLDTDVVCDRPVKPVLRAIAASTRISAQKEIGSVLAEQQSIGAMMVTCDPRLDASLEGRSGFNSGILSFPDAQAADLTLRTIAACVHRHARHNQGRSTILHYDQAAANYVGLLHDAVDTRLLTPFITLHVGETLRNNDGVLTERAPDDRRGFVHFWGSDDKPRRMKDYIAALEAP